MLVSEWSECMCHKSPSKIKVFYFGNFTQVNIPHEAIPYVYTRHVNIDNIPATKTFSFYEMTSV